MSEIFVGRSGLTSARILRDSQTLNGSGSRLITWEVTYPRLVLAEVNTHRVFSRNSSSSRAIPFDKMAEHLLGRPVRFGQNQAGMQDRGVDYAAPVLIKRYEELTDDGHTGLFVEDIVKMSPEDAWDFARESALGISRAFHEAGYHKQVTGRLTEPFQMMKTVISTTQTGNFFWLRNHGAADPTFEELAKCMFDSAMESRPFLIRDNEWHLPYVDVHFTDSTAENTFGDQVFTITPDGETLELLDAIKVSCARSCAVSFRNTDYDLVKSNDVYARLVGDDRIHGSALEHAATPISRTIVGSLNDPADPSTWQAGISHVDRNGDFWSGNFKGWIQHRKTIPDENKDA